MDISINHKPADITLDTEKTLGEVLSGIEAWISPTRNRIRRISADGEVLEDETLAEAFSRDINDIKKLDIVVTPWRDLAAEALEVLLDTCKFYMDAPFSGRAQVNARWEESAAARFMASDISDLYNLAGATLLGEGLSASDLCILIEERLREISDPRQETTACETLVKTIAERMGELPLDIQTGKDQRAAETVQLFARTGEKLFRILFVLELEGLSLDNFIIDTFPARVFIDEFNVALKELSAAFENRDTVLVGDIAEYELSPRLLKFYEALRNITESYSSVMPLP